MLGDSVLAGGAVSQSCLGRTEKHTLTALLAGGIAHPSLSSRGFCSTPQSRFSWVRSARRDEEQVFLLRCQGDADWFPGQVSHSPPLSVALVPRAKGEAGAGGGRLIDRPEKAVPMRESPSALGRSVNGVAKEEKLGIKHL